MNRLRVRGRPARTWVLRLLAVFMAAGFLGTGAVDAYGLHRCPHHDALPGSAVPAGGHGHDSTSHDGVSHDGASHDDRTGDSHGDHGPCTCVGACGLTGAVLPVPAAATAVLADAIDAGRRVHPAAGVLPRHIAFLLPFANAPPSMR